MNALHNIRMSLTVFLVTIALGSALEAQNTYRGCCPPYGSQDVSDVHITYGGRVYLSLPNYDVFLSGAPQTVSDLATGAGIEEARVIYRNDRGMRWDGNEFFLHPAYPVEQITRNRYINRVVGEGDATWPPQRDVATTTYTVPTYPTTYPQAPQIGLNHGPMPNTVPFTGNAWVVQPQTVVEQQPTPVTPPTIYYDPPKIVPAETPTTGRVRK